MPSGNSKRKRAVASCTQCYSKKQKCNHQYPCNHCTRRRRPELCSYAWPELRTEDTDTQPAQPQQLMSEERSPSPGAVSGSTRTATTALPRHNTVEASFVPQLDSMSRPFEASLPSCFGYFNGSDSNLLSLMTKYDLLDQEELEGTANSQVPGKLVPEIRAHFHLLPKRPILHYLVQNFFKEVNWIHGLIYPTTFFSQYERWWNAFSPRRTEDVEFGLLLLRICAYSAQFLPSRTYTADTICGVSISMVREQCHRLAVSLTRVCESAGGLRSFTSVQSLCFAVAFLKNEGRMKEAWYLMGNLITIAYNLEIHLEATTLWPSQLNDLEREMRRRAFWNLYIWDRHWSLVLDRSPYIHDEYCNVLYPKMRLVLETDDPATPDTFLERTLQAQLAKVWHSILCQMKSDPRAYDPVIAEEQYDRLCREFIFKLPSEFDLTSPSKQCDQLLRPLACQRQMLRISIFSLLCQVYRPLLRLNQAQVDAMPRYKRSLLMQHRTHLVNAATSLLDSVAQLHSDMGGNQTRYFLISFYTFEPAMLLTIYLLGSVPSSCTTVLTQGEQQHHHVLDSTDAPDDSNSLNVKMPNVARCRAEIDRALGRLNMLREVSPIAELGARKVHQMVARLDLLEQDIRSDQDEAEERTRPNSAHGDQELPMQDHGDHGQQGVPIDLAPGRWPDTVQEGWVDEAFNLTMNSAGTYWTEELFTEPYVDNLLP